MGSRLRRNDNPRNKLWGKIWPLPRAAGLNKIPHLRLGLCAVKIGKNLAKFQPFTQVRPIIVGQKTDDGWRTMDENVKNTKHETLNPKFILRSNTTENGQVQNSKQLRRSGYVAHAKADVQIFKTDSFAVILSEAKNLIIHE